MPERCVQKSVPSSSQQPLPLSIFPCCKMPSSSFLFLFLFLLIFTFSDGRVQLWWRWCRWKNGRANSDITLRNGLVCILPACCDLGGTTLSGIGLLFTTASVWQMLRGSIILFTGILSVVFLKRKLEKFKWVGMVSTSCRYVCARGCSLSNVPPGSQGSSYI